MKEIWRDIPGFSRYQVSNTGKVRSLPANCKVNITRQGKKSEEIWCRRGKVLSAIRTHDFRQVHLYTEDGVRRDFSVKYLVAWRFLADWCSTYDEFKSNYKADFKSKDVEDYSVNNLRITSRRSTLT